MNSETTLNELAERAGRWHRQSRESWLACAATLMEARAVCPHGEWAAFLDRAGIGERTAHNMLRVARAGLKSESISDLGGIAATLDYLRAVDDAMVIWRACMDAAPADEVAAVRAAYPDGPVSLAAWTEFAHALADAANDDDVSAAWCLAPWRRRNSYVE